MNVVEKTKTHILRTVTFFPENCAVYEIMSKNVEKPDRPQMTIWRMRVACRINKPTGEQAQAHAHALASTHAHTHTEISNTYCFSTGTVVS